MTLRLDGVTANRSAIGARLRLTVVCPDGSRRDIHRVIGGDSGHGSQPLRAEIGLGDATSIASLEIVWPGSARQIVTGLKPDTSWRIREGEAARGR